MPSSHKTWLLGSLLVGLALLAAAWMLLLSPVRDQTALLNTDSEVVEQNNSVLSAEVAKLKAQFAEIETYRKELAELETRIPREVDYESLLGEVERAADKAEVSLLSIMSEGPISPVKPPGVAAAEPASSGTEGDDEAPVSEAPAAPAPTGPLTSVIEGFYQVPMAITVEGDYSKIREFLTSFQEGSKRAILVTETDINALEERASSAQLPEAEDGDLSVTLRAFAFVLAYDLSGVPDAGAENVEKPALPKPAKDNVFYPKVDS